MTRSLTHRSLSGVTSTDSCHVVDTNPLSFLGGKHVDKFHKSHLGLDDSRHMKRMSQQRTDSRSCCPLLLNSSEQIIYLCQGALVAVWKSAGFAFWRLQVRISAGASSHQGLLSLPSLRVGKWVPAVAGKAKAGIAHSACRWNTVCR